MSQSDFLPFTLLAGAAFGCALLWVLVQWLRADEIADSVEREVQGSMQKLAATQAPKPPPPLSPEDAAREAYEARLAWLLWWWGIGGTVVGMAIGGLWSSFAGALLGGIVAPVLTTIGVMVAMKIKAHAPVETPAPAPTPEPSENEALFAEESSGARHVSP